MVINKDNHVKNVLVYVSSKIEGKFDAATAPVLADQVGCMFTSHVIAVRVQQPVEFKNSDPMMHNVHGMGAVNPEFNFTVRPGGKESRKFTEPEIGMRVKCDVHPWMLMYVHVLAHPYFGLTKDDGAFEIKGLPAGERELTFWHEKLGEKKVKVKIEAGKTATQDITFEQP
jgi:plastocyanin